MSEEAGRAELRIQNSESRMRGPVGLAPGERAGASAAAGAEGGSWGPHERRREGVRRDAVPRN
jgi:hypothetical protein